MASLPPAIPFEGSTSYFQKILIKFFFLFFAFLIVPWDYRFFSLVWDILVNKGHFEAVIRFASCLPSFFPDHALKGYGVESLYNLGIITVLSFSAALVWQKLTKEGNNDALLKLTRVLVRYKLAFVLICYGLYKVMLWQMPYPSLSSLHTNYGDFSDWKIYYHTIGITPEYEVVLGFLEITAAVLLVIRRTATLGAGFAAGFMSNIVAVNYYYDVPLLSLSLVVFTGALFLLSYDIPRLYRLLILQQKVRERNSDQLKLSFLPEKISNPLRTAYIVLLMITLVSSFFSATSDNIKIPRGVALKDSRGYYNVRLFILNNDTLPYSLTDSLRWQNVVFEDWPTISIKINKKVAIEEEVITGIDHPSDRNYEFAGTAGRHYFGYRLDTVARKISFISKSSIGKESYQLVYNVAGNTIFLSGINQRRDSVYIVLDKIEKEYLLHKGLRRPVTL